MEDSTLMSEGLTLMLTGMGFVFVFLTVLVLVTTLMSWIITRYEKSVGVLPAEGIPAPTAVLGRNQSAQSKQKSQIIIALISFGVPIVARKPRIC